jgi:hypothetical protein
MTLSIAGYEIFVAAMMAGAGWFIGRHMGLATVLLVDRLWDDMANRIARWRRPA